MSSTDFLTITRPFQSPSLTDSLSPLKEATKLQNGIKERNEYNARACLGELSGSGERDKAKNSFKISVSIREITENEA